MTTGQDRSIPYAIVGGAALIGLGLFFGLRSGSGPASAPPSGVPSGASPSASPSGAARSSSPPSGERVPPPPLPPAPDRKVVEADVSRALDAQRPLLRERCWTPLVAKNPKPEAAAFLIDVGVDATGLEVARGINTPEGSREDVANCLRMLVAPVKVAPPGKATTVRVTVRLP